MRHAPIHPATKEAMQWLSGLPEELGGANAGNIDRKAHNCIRRVDVAFSFVVVTGELRQAHNAFVAALNALSDRLGAGGGAAEERALIVKAIAELTSAVEHASPNPISRTNTRT